MHTAALRAAALRVAVLPLAHALGACAADERACDASEVLRDAARAYASPFRDTARYQIRVPGAAPKQEVVEFGADGRRVYLRMPELYVLEQQAGRLRVLRDGREDRFVEVLAGDDLQATADTAFGGQGSPLVPAPLLLREARSDAERIAAFRTRLLTGLRAGACRTVSGVGKGMHREIELTADNGRVTAHFDAATHLLRSMRLEIVPALGEPPIHADAAFAPNATPPPQAVTLLEAQRVSSIAALDGDEHAARPNELAAFAFTAADGSRVSLSDYRGSVVVVEFWARWCAPCRVTLPAIERFATWAREEDLAVKALLVNTQEEFASLEQARKETTRFLRWSRLQMPTLFDPGSEVHRQTGGGLPLTLVFAPDGRLVGQHAGFKGDLESALRVEARELLKGKGP